LEDQAMTEVSLGRFGDRRLEKGGPSCTLVWWRRAGVGFGFVGSAVIVRERSA
jgi:hypothetical protein